MKMYYTYIDMYLYSNGRKNTRKISRVARLPMLLRTAIERNVVSNDEINCFGSLSIPDIKYPVNLTTTNFFSIVGRRT